MKWAVQYKQTCAQMPQEEIYSCYNSYSSVDKVNFVE